MYAPVLFETSFSYDKDVWIASTIYYMHFYIIVLFPLTAILQLMNFAALYFFSLLINAVILLLNCFVLVLYLYIHFLSLIMDGLKSPVSRCQGYFRNIL